MRTFLVIALFVSAASAAGGERFVPHWEAKCQLNKEQLVVVAHSASGDPTEDDMQVTLSLSGRSSAISLPAGLYVQSPIIDVAGSMCEHLAAFRTSSGNILILLAKDDRPSSDQLVAVLIDSQSRFILDVKSNILELPPRSQAFAKHGEVHVLAAPKTSAKGPESGAWACLREHNGKIEIGDGANR